MRELRQGLQFIIHIVTNQTGQGGDGSSGSGRQSSDIFCVNCSNNVTRIKRKLNARRMLQVPIYILYNINNSIISQRVLRKEEGNIFIITIKYY